MFAPYLFHYTHIFYVITAWRDFSLPGTQEMFVEHALVTKKGKKGTERKFV